MKRLLPWASYLIFIPLMLFVTVACGSLSLLVSLWDKSGRQQHAIAQLWAKLMLGIALSPMKVVNPQNLHLGRAAVFASNHLSYMDTPALFGSLPFQFRILANHYLFKIPFIGWHLTRSGQVPIDQSSMRSQVAGLMRGVATLKSGMPLLIFPDGGRSSDGHIRQFLQGAAFMAIKAQVPLVPLALVGTYELLPMHTYHLTPRPLLLVACDPIETTGMTTKDAESLTQRLLDAISAEYYRHSQLAQPETVPANQAKIPSSQL
jgi:1-acyl-sn-glycerol-3-phosphate acyltransferase